MATEWDEYVAAAMNRQRDEWDAKLPAMIIQDRDRVHEWKILTSRMRYWPPELRVDLAQNHAERFGLDHTFEWRATSRGWFKVEIKRFLVIVPYDYVIETPDRSLWVWHWEYEKRLRESRIPRARLV